MFSPQSFVRLVYLLLERTRWSKVQVKAGDRGIEKEKPTFHCAHFLSIT
jgi:hypothetical protein